MKKQIMIFLLSLAPLGYAAEMNQAVILEHRSWVSGANEQGRAIEGHIEKNIDNKKERNLQERSENLLSKTLKQKS
ncbi:hypothetical protein [Legionella sp. 29fVS95]|uniref:hypothetical protein n=1 Tax=Legionella sp. 29fVS95 TaxID=3402813 RepID=UPI003AF77F89